MHEINKTFEGIRLLNTYGFKLHKTTKEVIEQTLSDNKVKSWIYVPKLKNYVDVKTGELMFAEKYMPSSKVEYLIENQADMSNK